MITKHRLCKNTATYSDDRISQVYNNVFYQSIMLT